MSRPDKFSQKIIGAKDTEDKVFQLNDRDAIIYALGIGFSRDPLRQQDYPYTYELNQNFTTFPTFASCMTKFDISLLLSNPNAPQFSPFKILHAQQRLQMVKPQLESGATYYSRQQIVDVQDKGKNAIVVIRIKSFTKNSEGNEQLAFINDMSFIIRGYGGFGFKGVGATVTLPKIPESKPDHIIKASSYDGQAFLYRLSGDINPLHVDPNISSMQGFQKPILHGLGSYGIVARAIVQELLGNDSSLLKSYHVRFVGHVFPGENYEILVWRDGNNKMIFQANVVERGTKAIIGTCEIRQKPKL